MATLEKRTDDDLRKRLTRLDEEVSDPGERMRKSYELCRRLYAYASIESEGNEEPEEPMDVRGHRETWDDMVRLQEEGVYPAAFSAIRSPVLMVHGAYDPHPGEMIRASLAEHVPQLEYREWERCGHEPWEEEFVREDFFAVLRGWLGKHMIGGAGKRE